MRDTIMTTCFTPTTITEAVGILADNPELCVVNGGTDVMVSVNAGSKAIAGWLNLRRVDEIAEIKRTDRGLRIGSGVTFARIEYELQDIAPALAIASTMVGSRQIRSVATLGGNICTASPAGDSLPPLLTYDTEIELASHRGVRTIPLVDFLVGPKRTVIANDEIVSAIFLNDCSGPQHFAKIGTRNAMVISICSIAARLDINSGVARVAVGSVGPTAMLITEANESLLQRHCADEFANIVESLVTPINDHRATAEYRSASIGVLARRIHQNLWDAL